MEATLNQLNGTISKLTHNGGEGHSNAATAKANSVVTKKIVGTATFV